MTDAGFTIKPTLAQDIHDCFISCLNLTNKNLLNLEKRLRSKTERRGVYFTLFQSEALSIFKGNFTRLLKVVIGSNNVNRLKSLLLFEITLDPVHNIVTEVKINSHRLDKYLSPDIKMEFATICDVLLSITDAEYEREAYESLKSFVEEESSKKQVNVSHSEIVDDIKQLSFKSIENIKFTK